MVSQASLAIISAISNKINFILIGLSDQKLIIYFTNVLTFLTRLKIEYIGSSGGGSCMTGGREGGSENDGENVARMKLLRNMTNCTKHVIW